MVRLLLFLAVLCALALGISWLADQPDYVVLTSHGKNFQVSLLFATGVVIALAFVIAALWGIIRFVFRIPSLVSLANRARRREKGFAALTRGIVAVRSADTRAPRRHPAHAHRL